MSGYGGFLYMTRLACWVCWEGHAWLKLHCLTNAKQNDRTCLIHWRENPGVYGFAKHWRIQLEKVVGHHLPFHCVKNKSALRLDSAVAWHRLWSIRKSDSPFLSLFSGEINFHRTRKQVLLRSKEYESCSDLVKYCWKLRILTYIYSFDYESVGSLS